MGNIRILHQEPDFAYQRRYVERHLEAYYKNAQGRSLTLKKSVQDREVMRLYRGIIRLENYFLDFYYEHQGLKEKYLRKKGLVPECQLKDK